MSRNVRQKYPPKPARVPKSRDYDSSSLDLSDDSGYSGVEDVTDSEDDDEDVFAAEEEHIINASRKRALDPPRPLVADEDDDADEESEADEEDEAEPEEADPADDSASWDGFSSDHDELLPAHPVTRDLLDQVSITPGRHVRFVGVPDSDTDSTTSETSEVSDMNGFFPDIFVEQSALDPMFRREIEDDDETSSQGSFWDFHNGSQEIAARRAEDEAAVRDFDLDIDSLATPRPNDPPIDMSATVVNTAEVQDLDGYETDGDTTEEDIPEPIIRKKQIRRSRAVDASSDSDTERPASCKPGKPRVGRFNLDRSDNKPIGVVDPATGKMIIFTPRRTNQLDLSPESLHLDFSAQDLASPLVRNPGFVMMGAMASSNTFGDFMNMQPFGPTEAFFPCTPGIFPGEEESDDSYFAGIEEDEEESLLKIEDFVTLNNDSSDEEEEEPFSLWNGDVASSPTRPKTAASNASAAAESAPAAHPLLTHFDSNSDVVGAFRRNQINQQLIYSDKASQESLAFSGPYYHGTLRGIKTGSMETVTTPITPIRRQKRSNTIGSGFGDIQQSSPLNVVSQKRKASGNHVDANLHKRHRSISEMEILRI
ncbi:hypothetical protein CHGG_03749 [Chaetomium globosum CBS 148.51]|uniref:Uncharacterized protein n=1 Tax=Chaetomium globosum (strain ATCC 6205 / CBS 148.51 / DSM 1962 / NBRC 6347 / NRRL 1970) TaxID=306901 RepID=Q2H397_CHAGB|nr:uncharacterized protein CHGG_03749 [Chaetomium globosum CBS 148.51]EAQ87130.1 hypothetical protein CHGG_03749 [Chaetomium globosum CBS 148.51]